ncbi:MAG TPA: NUDIX domain-containing protein [Kineosporiaceae bacterium]
MTGPVWTPSDELVLDVRHALAHAPRHTPEDRFEAWAWRALLDEGGPALLTRHARPSHVTASAIVLSPDGLSTCLVLHGRIGRWVQPGGHLEPGDTSLAGAAAREVCEETGLTGRVLPAIACLSRHRAPCHPDVDWHLDVQSVLVTDRIAPQLSAESTDVRWWDVDALPADLAPGVAAAVHRAVSRLRTASTASLRLAPQQPQELHLR